MSLIVVEQKFSGKRLYDRLGYIDIAKERIIPHLMIHYKGDALLMVKNI